MEHRLQGQYRSDAEGEEILKDCPLTLTQGLSKHSGEVRGGGGEGRKN